MSVSPVSRMGTPYVEIPVSHFFCLSLSSHFNDFKSAPKVTTKSASPANGLQEDLKADSTSPAWSPACGGCVQQQLICCQGYNTSYEPLAVCAQCHRTSQASTCKISWLLAVLITPFSFLQPLAPPPCKATLRRKQRFLLVRTSTCCLN
jgi:hypothetical protein